MKPKKEESGTAVGVRSSRVSAKATGESAVYPAGVNA